MAVNYKRPRKLLIDKVMKKNSLERETKIMH